jgi:hypothetical protein
MSYLCYLCLLAYRDVQHIVLCFCFICLRLVSCVPVLPVSLDCPVLIAHSVIFKVY